MRIRPTTFATENFAQWEPFQWKSSCKSVCFLDWCSPVSGSKCSPPVFIRLSGRTGGWIGWARFWVSHWTTPDWLHSQVFSWGSRGISGFSFSSGSSSVLRNGTRWTSIIGVNLYRKWSFTGLVWRGGWTDEIAEWTHPDWFWSSILRERNLYSAAWFLSLSCTFLQSKCFPLEMRCSGSWSEWTARIGT